MANDIKDPGPNNDYPWFPRDANGYPLRTLDTTTTLRPDRGRVLHLDTTPRTADGDPISAIAPRIIKHPGQGARKEMEWIAARIRYEVTTSTGPNGEPVKIIRNIDTGEQHEY
jgi:hypothetical protein